MKAPVITPKYLEDNHACTYHRRKFIRTFGKNGASLTVANAIKAAKAGLDLSWLAYKVVPRKLHDQIERQANRSPAGKAITKLYREQKKVENKFYKKIRQRRVELANANDCDIYTAEYYAAMATDRQYKALSRQIGALEREHEKLYAKARIARDIVYARLIVPQIRKYWGQRE